MGYKLLHAHGTALDLKEKEVIYNLEHIKQERMQSKWQNNIG